MHSQKSLHAQKHALAVSSYQLKVLNPVVENHQHFISFSDALSKNDLFPLKPVPLEIFQVNLGKMCNQTCAHCHVDAGPDRKEIMTKETLELCLEILQNTNIQIVDLTGGAPEMNPNFRWFVEEISKLNKKILVRCNLTIIVSNKKYNDLPKFYSDHKIEVISSLPYYTQTRTDKQRGDGVFDASIRALKLLNAEYYGVEGSGKILNLVYNPSGAFLAGDQKTLEAQFKKELLNRFQVHFNQLFCITNMPISRFLDYLIQSGNYIEYMQKLIDAYNPLAAERVMCRNTISVSWDGYLYDCDFNQMLDLKIDLANAVHLKQWNGEILQGRNIIVNQHCFGCTAGSGSSCGGEVV